MDTTATERTPQTPEVARPTGEPAPVQPEGRDLRTALEQVLGFVERWGEEGHIPLCGSLDGDPCTCGLDEARATLAAEVGPDASKRALADVGHQRDVLERRLEEVEHERDRLLALVDTGAEVSPPLPPLPLYKQIPALLARLDAHAIYLRGYRNATLAGVADDCQAAARMLRDLRSDHTAMMRMWIEETQAGALIAAEIDRLQRLTTPTGESDAHE